MSPQDCARFLGHLVDDNSVSLDFPSFRWHSSAQAASLAMATEYLSKKLRARSLYARVPSVQLAPALEATVTSC